MSDLQTTEEKCSALDDTISEMNSVKAKVGVDSSEVDQANTIIQYCVAQKQQLEAPAVMNVDVSPVSYTHLDVYKRQVMPYLFDDLRLSSFFSGIGAFECALDRLYESINKIEKRLG